MVWKACVGGCHDAGERVKEPGVDAKYQKVTCRCLGVKAKKG